MNWHLVARKELDDLHRSGQLAYLCALLGVLLGLAAYLVAHGGSDDPAVAKSFVATTTLGLQLLVPIVGLVVSYETVVKRRAGGQMKLLLGQPHSRRGIVLGTFVGRAVGVAVITAVGMGVALGVLLVTGGGGAIDASLGISLVLTVIFGVAFAGIGVGISASTDSSTLVSVAAFGAFLLLVVLWPQAVSMLRVAAEWSSTLTLSTAGWRQVTLLSPAYAYDSLVSSLALSGQSASPFGVEVENAGLLPWGVLAAWTVGPLLVGIFRFERAEI